MVDMNMLAAVHYFDNTMAPFSFAAVVISVGLCLDYAIHIAREFTWPSASFTPEVQGKIKSVALVWLLHVEEFLIAEGTGDQRAQQAIGRVGRAVFNGGFTTFLGMAILSTGPGKPFYAFGFQFCYMVALGLFHGLLVLSVLLSWYNPPSIGWLMKGSKTDQYCHKGAAP